MILISRNLEELQEKELSGALNLSLIPCLKDQNLTKAERLCTKRKILFQDQKTVPSIGVNNILKNIV
jgi:hypothetical protein